MTRIRKISVSVEEFNKWLQSRGLKPLPADFRTKRVDPAKGDPDVFGSEPPAVTEKPKAPTQPTWKWSWDPEGGLVIWPVDEKYGQPHHIEVTGPNFYNLAQGRVYEDGEGGYEILVWEDRASDEWQEEAADEVNEWLLANTGQEASGTYWQSEGGYYQTIQGQKPDLDKMIETYYGIRMDRLPEWKKNKMRQQHKSLFGFSDDDLAPDPIYQHQLNDQAWLEDLATHESLDQAWQQAYRSGTTQVCPTCQGEGTDISGHLCLTCHGHGTDQKVAFAV